MPELRPETEGASSDKGVALPGLQIRHAFLERAWVLVRHNAVRVIVKWRKHSTETGPDQSNPIIGPLPLSAALHTVVVSMFTLCSRAPGHHTILVEHDHSLFHRQKIIEMPVKV